MAIRVFYAEVNTNMSIDYNYPRKGLNLLFLQRLDSYLESSKFQFPSLLDLSSLYFFYLHFIFSQIFSFLQVYKIFILRGHCHFLRFLGLFLQILVIQTKKLICNIFSDILNRSCSNFNLQYTFVKLLKRTSAFFIYIFNCFQLVFEEI